MLFSWSLLTGHLPLSSLEQVGGFANASSMPEVVASTWQSLNLGLVNGVSSSSSPSLKDASYSCVCEGTVWRIRVLHIGAIHSRQVKVKHHFSLPATRLRRLCETFAWLLSMRIGIINLSIVTCLHY
ncbi:unnamed protein product [Sphagnum tenellum]